MEYQEIALDEAIYEVRRIYSGDRPAAELLLERLIQTCNPNPSFDGTHANII